MQKTKRGFTIVELVIVIAVIAILAAVLIPTFRTVIFRADSTRVQINNYYVELEEKVNKTISGAGNGISGKKSSENGKDVSDNKPSGGSTGGSAEPDSHESQIGDIKQNPEKDICHHTNFAPKYDSIDEALAVVTKDTASITLDCDVTNGRITLDSVNAKPKTLKLVLNNHSFSGTLWGANDLAVEGQNGAMEITGGTFSGNLKADKSVVTLGGDDLKMSGKIDSYIGTVNIKAGDFGDAEISVTTPSPSGANANLVIDGGRFKDGQEIKMNAGQKAAVVKIKKAIVSAGGITLETNAEIKLKDGKTIVLVPSAGKQIAKNTDSADPDYYIFVLS